MNCVGSGLWKNGRSSGASSTGRGGQTVETGGHIVSIMTQNDTVDEEDLEDDLSRHTAEN
jgi:hypothetical protein